MSWFMSAIYDRFMSSAEEACLVAWRGELLAGLAGDVLEIGAGTGANLRHYPAAVTRLVLSEPDRHMFAKLEERVRRDGGHHRSSDPGKAADGPCPSIPLHTRAVELSAPPSDALPFADGSFDAVVSTLVLCSVGDLDRTLREVARVLRPGGSFVYLEHVAADDRPARLRWQGRVEPVWKRIAGNCHLTRRTGAAIRRAGFEIERELHESMRKANPLSRATIRGVARKPLAATTT